MASGLPSITGDVLTSTTFNSLVLFTLNTQSAASYTVVLADVYQSIVITSNASTKTVYIPTDATLPITSAPVGTAITVYNSGAGLLTVTATTPGTTTVVSAGATLGSPTVGQYKSCVLVKLAANSWTVLGAVS
jgi:hypothetical protein